MPKLSPNTLPKYRRHKASGQAIVPLNGRDHYLGRYGTKASRVEYDRMTSEWLANGRQPLSTSASGPADLTPCGCALSANQIPPQIAIDCVDLRRQLGIVLATAKDLISRAMPATQVTGRSYDSGIAKSPQENKKLTVSSINR